MDHRGIHRPLPSNYTTRAFSCILSYIREDSGTPWSKNIERKRTAFTALLRVSWLMMNMHWVSLTEFEGNERLMALYQRFASPRLFSASIMPFVMLHVEDSARRPTHKSCVAEKRDTGFKTCVIRVLSEDEWATLRSTVERSFRIRSKEPLKSWLLSRRLARAR